MDKSMALIEHCTKRIILASASPRRQALFKLICDNFEIIESQIDESKVVAQKPHDVVVELAQCKAISVAQTVQDGLIIGADSVVVLDDEILGKPSCEAEGPGHAAKTERPVSHRILPDFQFCACLKI